MFDFLLTIYDYELYFMELYKFSVLIQFFKTVVAMRPVFDLTYVVILEL